MTRRFNPVTQEDVTALCEIVGESNVVFDDPDRLTPYRSDESGEHHASDPEAVVKPQTSDDVSRVVAYCSERRIPITARGAGSGLAGGAVPLFGGVVLSFEKMSKILEIDTENMVAVVEPGVVTNDLCRRVSEDGLFYAGYPMSVESSFVGGNIACNAGGAKVIKYGATEAHVLGLEVVLASGEILHLGGKRRKDSSGYSLLRLMVGSEGTLGLITKAYLRLIPQPGPTADLLVPFQSTEDAVDAFPKAVMASVGMPSAVEFIDRQTMLHAMDYTGNEVPRISEAEAYLIIQIEAPTKNALLDAYRPVGEACLDAGALEVYVADNPWASERIWAIRRNCLEALRVIDPTVEGGDFVVPSSEIPAMMTFIREMSLKYQVEIPCSGHVADGNIHPHPLRPEGKPLDDWVAQRHKLLSEIALKAVELGGAVSGEHGVGFLKNDILAQSKRDELRTMKAIKDALDPKGILNPGKLFT
ncbi:FAD-binding oxidoreductase [Candidatus Bipolaricaulota bacterium]